VGLRLKPTLSLSLLVLMQLRMDRPFVKFQAWVGADWGYNFTIVSSETGCLLQHVVFLETKAAALP
jgi:hypothetical protein